MRYNKTFLLRGAGMALALSLLTSCGNQSESIPAQPQRRRNFLWKPPFPGRIAMRRS